VNAVYRDKVSIISEGLRAKLAISRIPT